MATLAVVSDSEFRLNNFEPSVGITTAQAEDLFKVHGPNELPEKKDPYVGY